MLSSAETAAPWLTNIFPFMASAFPLLGIVYTMMAETITETEAEEKQERAQLLTALTELAKQTNVPIATLRRALTSGSRFNPASLLAMAKRTTPETSTILATPPLAGTSGEPSDANSPITGQIVAIGRDPLTSGNERGMNGTLASVPNEANPDKLQMTIEALKANPHITDEALAEYLALKRPASARFWRLKAIECSMRPGDRDNKRVIWLQCIVTHGHHLLGLPTANTILDLTIR